MAIDSISNFFLDDINYYKDLALLLIRIIVGLLFIFEFRIKFSDIKGFAKADGVPYPIAVILTWAELAGAVGLILGVFTQFAALGLMLIMVGSIYKHVIVWKSPYRATSGGWEYDLMIFAMMLLVVSLGGGEFSIKPLPATEWLPFLG